MRWRWGGLGRWSSRAGPRACGRRFGRTSAEDAAMCGIIGYIGSREAVPLLLDGLKRLEYRGYDSAGLAVLRDAKIDLRRSVGKLTNLEKAVNGAGMADPDGPMQPRAVHGLFKVGQFAHTAAEVDLRVTEHGQAGRVVASVFEALQPVEQ